MKGGNEDMAATTTINNPKLVQIIGNESIHMDMNTITNPSRVKGKTTATAVDIEHITNNNTPTISQQKVMLNNKPIRFSNVSISFTK